MHVYDDGFSGEVAHTPRPKSRLLKAEIRAWNIRAWTFQEWLLPPRILHCTASELAWECATKLCRECKEFPTILNTGHNRRGTPLTAEALESFNNH